MKKSQLDHVLRAAGRIKGEKEFLVIGSQSLHGTCPDVPDEILSSAEADLVAKTHSERTEWLNAIGQDSPFHESFGYYADPVDEGTAVLAKGWKERLVPLAPGDTEGVRGLCLDPHDLAITKYAAHREKDLLFNRQLAARGIVRKPKLLDLLESVPVSASVRERMRGDIERDFATPGMKSQAKSALKSPRPP